MFWIVNLIQIISIVIVFMECVLVFDNWKTPLHSNLFLSCVGTLINNMGYFFQISAKTEESYLGFLFISYLGRVWIIFGLFFFIMELVKIKMPGAARCILAFMNIVTYVILVTTQRTGLYYRDMEFSSLGQFHYLARKNGIWHYVWDLLVLIYVAAGTTALIHALHREKSPVGRKRLKLVLLAIVAESLFTIIQMLRIFPLTKVYDVTMLGFPISTVIMLVAIKKYKLLNTELLARDYVIDELSEGIIATNRIGKVTYYNKPALALFPDLLTYPHNVINTIDNAIEAEVPLSLDFKVFTPVKNTLHQEGIEAGTLYALTDDTEHYRYMSELEEQRRIADEANRAKSAFLANMSHEIRTPINAVLGMDEMILRETREKQIRSYAVDIKKAGRTLLSLINDILDFSKIEEGRMEIIPTQYELFSVINDLVNMIRPRAGKKGLKLKVEADPEAPHLLYGDEIRIKQVALNILTNAVKYTETGEISFKLGFEKISENEIDLLFRISDTGIGMKEEDMEALFSPFTRIEEKRNRTIEGTGLGMSIVRQLLDLMGSQLEVKSVYGKGSEFSYAIRQQVIKWDPIGDVGDRFEMRETEEAVYRELFRAPDARILVVDDTEVNLTVIQNLLKKTQMNIDTASSGREALSAAADNSYDMIFIDHMMPDMDGIETLHALKEQGIPDETVCVALTANAVSGAREMYLKEGFSDYISKPVDGSRLEKMICRYLPKEKLLSAAEAEKEAVSAVSMGNMILVVDDDEVICAAAEEILGRAYKVVCCRDGETALKKVKEERPALILLDINLGGMNGFEVLQRLKEDAALNSIPVMFITADEDREKEALGLKNGALDFIRKPFIPEVLLERSRRIISLDRYQKDLKGEVRKQTRRAERLTREMMEALSHTVDAKDHYTNGHSERVAAYAAEIGRRMGKSPEEQRLLYEAGLLHDIGKIGIPEEIITKKEALTRDEFGEIKEHTVIGDDILKGITDVPALREGARSHHERYDGSGYPDGLSGDAIPEIARIICVADCYDAMTSTRSYSKPKTHEVVREEIERCSGKNFDPRVARIMIEMIDEDKEGLMNEHDGAGTTWKAKAQLWDEDTVHPAAVEEKPAEETELPEWIYGISELDVQSGVANCGSGESLLSVMRVFHNTAGYKADEIEELLKNEDIENYTIKVHALKSASRIIGAASLSDMARKLEEAGKAGDTKTILSGTPELLKRYRALREKLDPLSGEKKELKEMSKSMRKEAYQTIGEAAMSMDYGMMEQLIKDIRGYALSEKDEIIIDGIEKRLMQLDWEGIEEMVRE